MRKMSLKLARRLFILLCAIVLINSLRFNAPRRHNKDKSSISMKQSKYNILQVFRKQYIVIIDKESEKIKTIKPKVINLGTFKVSAYNLLYQSTQKSRGSSGYGFTYTGFNLKGHTLESARVIAVDPRIISLGSKVRLTFKDDEYKVYNAIYTAKDIGGGIIGNHLDLFIGDSPDSKKRAKEFGVTQCELEIIKED